jgi:hypothetical protein
MAKITKSYESDIDLTIFTVSGEATFNELLDQTLTFFGVKPSNLVLWDFTLGTVAHISNREVKELAKQSSMIAAGLKGGKGAIVAPRDIDYGMSRVFQAFSELDKFSFKIEIFRDMNAAKKWLMSGQ